MFEFTEKNGISLPNLYIFCWWKGFAFCQLRKLVLDTTAVTLLNS